MNNNNTSLSFLKIASRVKINETLLKQRIICRIKQILRVILRTRLSYHLTTMVKSEKNLDKWHG